jgi:predicted nuclease of predicted toxin-antitoxin system
MRLLLDANLSPRITDTLRGVGHDVVHVLDVGLVTASDRTIVEHALADARIIVTADSDFPMLLALSGAALPSVVLLRGVAELSPDEHAQLLAANLPVVREDLERGAVVSLSPERIRVRDLPIG